ncbi:hypothetical protein GN956_G14566 [Arapaima gigas]
MVSAPNPPTVRAPEPGTSFQEAGRMCHENLIMQDQAQLSGGVPGGADRQAIHQPRTGRQGPEMSHATDTGNRMADVTQQDTVGLWKRLQRERPAG